MTRVKLLIIAIWLPLILPSQQALSKTVVTTYVTETQEKRRSTRWTLTEWLRIKERMRMMDLWLALVSDPKKDKFAPELSLLYNSYTGDLNLNHEGSAQETSFLEQKGSFARVQFWFTNLVSSTTGLKTPNIDLGFDYGLRKGEGAPGGGASYLSGATTLELTARNYDYTTVNMRIFGRNIQDTSLVLKWGQYKTDKGFIDQSSELDDSVSGLVSGVESYFYLMSWLGLEGNYLKFGNANGPAGSDEVGGELLEYGAFLEIYNLRLGYGEYQEEWLWGTQNYDLEYKESGQMLSVKLQF